MVRGPRATLFNHEHSSRKKALIPFRLLMYIFWEITVIVKTPISKSWRIYMFLAPLNIVLGNGLINIFAQQTRSTIGHPLLGNSSKYEFLRREGVFCGVRAKWLQEDSRSSQFGSVGSQITSSGVSSRRKMKFSSIVSCQRLENWVVFWRVGSPRRLNKKWQENFAVIWSDSSCVEIRCQDTISGDWESWCVCNWWICSGRVSQSIILVCSFY
jgi:hypothetical protein